MTRDDALHAELLEMMRVDQRTRVPVFEPQRAREVDARNTARLRAIVDAHGWPGASLVGADGARAAWLIAQHADADVAFQRRCLELMRAMPSGEVSPGSIAYLTDRVRVNSGEPQLYGTQVGPPIEDPERVDERRAAVGLAPLADYLASFTQRIPAKTWARMKTPSTN